MVYLTAIGDCLRRDAEDVGCFGWVFNLLVLVFVLFHDLVHVVADIAKNILFQVSVCLPWAVKVDRCLLMRTLQ